MHIALLAASRIMLEHAGCRQLSMLTRVALGGAWTQQPFNDLKGVALRDRMVMASRHACIIYHARRQDLQLQLEAAFRLT